jgi:hypothetical protein
VARACGAPLTLSPRPAFHKPRADPFLEEALSALLDSHMLTNAQELQLIDSLPLGPDDRWLALLYRTKAKKVCGAQRAAAHLWVCVRWWGVGGRERL